MLTNDDLSGFEYFQGKGNAIEEKGASGKLVIVHGPVALSLDGDLLELMKRHFDCSVVAEMSADSYTPTQVYDMAYGFTSYSDDSILVLTDVNLDRDKMTAGNATFYDGVVTFHDVVDAMEESSRYVLCGGTVPPIMNAEETAIYNGLNALCAYAHRASVKAGWYHNPKTGEPIQRNFGELIALIHSEVSECLEAERKGLIDDKLPDRLGVETELADTFIRIGDLGGFRQMDLGGAVIAKMRFNAIRADHKPENRAAAGGKAF